MPDNTERIAKLQAILNSGVLMSTIKGEQITYDHDSIRRQIEELKRTDDATTAASGRRSKILRVRSA